MEYVKLGNTGLDVSRICLGCMGFGDPNKLHISEHSDHPFRDYTIADFAIIRSPIPRFSGHF